MRPGYEGGTGFARTAKDAYSFSLNYNTTDYKPINSNVLPFAALPNGLPQLNADGVATGKNLYNGNIKAMLVNIPKLGDPKVYGYQYDQLNRITAMNSYTGLDAGNNTFAPTVSADYKERVTYDANGNILTYLRNGTTANSSPLAMDNLTYNYIANSNRLSAVNDAVAAGNYTTDIDNQAANNYDYDEIGNLIKDNQEGITSIEWTVYGKISTITKSGGITIHYTYDASGHRISKTAPLTPQGGVKTTWYVRDASGNVMAVYENGNSGVNNGKLSQIEVHLYGSSRIGMWQRNLDVESANWWLFETTAMAGTGGGRTAMLTRGITTYELSNHLGNVLATVSDRKVQVQDPNNTEQVLYYTADVVSANDYYPFGMAMPGRKYEQPNSNYRYGFNGKEQDPEVKGSSAQYDYGFRIYDPRIGRFLSVDPLTSSYPELTPYQFTGNSPITFIDLDGLEMAWRNPATGEIIKDAGPLALPIGSRNAYGWVLLFQPPIRRPAANTSAPNPPVFKPVLQQGSDNLASIKAAQNKQIAIRHTVAKPAPLIPQDSGNFSAENRPEWQRRELAERTEQMLAFRKLQTRVSTDPVAMNGYLSASAMVSIVQAPVVAVEKGINNAQEGNWWGVAGNTLEFGLSIAPFIPFKGGVAVTGIGTATKGGAGVYDLGTTLGKYVGQSKDIMGRVSSHFAKGGKLSAGELNNAVFHSMPGSTILQREVYEQFLINKYGINNLLNVRNPMGGRMDLYNSMVDDVIKQFGLPR